MGWPEGLEKKEKDYVAVAWLKDEVLELVGEPGPCRLLNLTERLPELDSDQAIAECFAGLGNSVQYALGRALARWREWPRLVVGIDAPFGLPALLKTHGHLTPWNSPTSPPPSVSKEEHERYLKRRCERWFGRGTSSVSDRLGSNTTKVRHVVDSLRGRLREKCGVWPFTPNEEERRVQLVEVYPAATLEALGLPHNGYKSPNNRLRGRQLRMQIAAGLQDVPALPVMRPSQSAPVGFPMKRISGRGLWDDDEGDRLDAIVAAYSAFCADRHRLSEKPTCEVPRWVYGDPDVQVEGRFAVPHTLISRTFSKGKRI